MKHATCKTETCYKGLCKLRKLTPADRNLALKHCSAELIDAISEICFNCCNNRIPTLDQKRVNLLKKDKKAIEYIANSKNSNKNRRKRLIQEGGFLPKLLLWSIPYIGQLIANRFSKS